MYSFRVTPHAFYPKPKTFPENACSSLCPLPGYDRGFLASMSMLITSAYAMRVAAAMMTVAKLNRAIRRACSAIEFAGRWV